MRSPRPVNASVGQAGYRHDDDSSYPFSISVDAVNRRLEGFSGMGRWFTTLLVLLLLAAPFPAEAQRLPTVGYLSIGSASDPRRVALLSAFQQGLRDLGYVEGKSILVEVRFDEGNYDRLPDLAPAFVWAIGFRPVQLYDKVKLSVTRWGGRRP